MTAWTEIPQVRPLCSVIYDPFTTLLVGSKQIIIDGSRVRPPWGRALLCGLHVVQLAFAIVLLATLSFLGASPAVPQAARPIVEADCVEVGPGFVKIPGLNVCTKLGLDATLEGSDDFARFDLQAQSVRNTDGSVSATIRKSPRAREHKASGTLLIRPHLSAVAPTDYGPLWVHVRPSKSSVSDDLRDFSTSPMFVDDAWVSVGALTVGRRFSFFDYNPGFGYKPGYTSYRTTNLFALTAPLSDGLAATFSVEDGASRRRDDGIWALYEKPRLPDLVEAIHFNRDWGNAHASVALHPITHDGLLGCACTEESRALGFAGSAGAEYRQKFGETFGRIMVSAAVADGALDYLGIPRFAPDYISDADGAIRKTKGFSAIASYEHVWRRSLRTSMSFSVYGTTSAADSLRWGARGYLAQFTVEYMPISNLVLGAEINHFVDMLKAEDATSARDSEQAALDRLLLYVRRFF